MMGWLLTSLPNLAVALAALAVVMLGLALAIGGPGRPSPWPAMLDAFKAIDGCDLPPASFFGARDGSRLAYRRYPASGTARASAVLLHGSAGHSGTLHVLAKAIASTGHEVFALDLRGHGLSGRKGRIDHVGQLEHDMSDFLATVAPSGPRLLVGFSSGGGFAVRFAAFCPVAFDRVLLLAPYLGPGAPTVRDGRSRWAYVGRPRVIALKALNRFGIRALNHLPVVAFALDVDSLSVMTDTYDLPLATSFRPHDDLAADIRAIEARMHIMVGAEDEIVDPVRFGDVFKETRSPVPVAIVPALGHIGLVTDRRGLDAIMAAI